MIDIEIAKDSRLLLLITVTSDSPEKSQMIVYSVCAEGEVVINEQFPYD